MTGGIGLCKLKSVNLPILSLYSSFTQASLKPHLLLVSSFSHSISHCHSTIVTHSILYLIFQHPNFTVSINISS